MDEILLKKKIEPKENTESLESHSLLNIHKNNTRLKSRLLQWQEGYKSTLNSVVRT